VLGGVLPDRIDAKVALDAPEAAIQRRGAVPGMIHHMDRDCRHAIDEYQAVLRRRGRTPSMSRKDDCWSNAVAERLVATIEGGGCC
jgi:transposase InsO family protein